MNVVLCSVPVESPGAKLRRKRSEGPNPILPKSAITQLNDWAVKNEFPPCKFYDIDMLYPSDEEIEKYFRENNADVVGLSAVVSTSYMQVKRLARIIKKVNSNTVIVCGGYLTAAANTVLRKDEMRSYQNYLIPVWQYAQLLSQKLEEEKNNKKAIVIDAPVTDFINGITSYSLKPLYMGIFFGFISILISIAIIIYALFLKFSNLAVPGSTSIIIAISFPVI